MEEEQEVEFRTQCEQCDFVGVAKTLAAAKAKVTRHMSEHVGKPTEKKAEPTPPKNALEGKIEALTESVGKLSDIVKGQSVRIEEQGKENAELRTQLEEKKAVLSPESGPGPACEAYKIHFGEAWALRKMEGDDRYEPVPAGHEIRKRSGTPYVVEMGMPNDQYISNCRSMYTAPYTYKGVRRPGQVEYPEYEAHLCKQHAHTMIGKSLDETEGNITTEQIDADKVAA